MPTTSFSRVLCHRKYSWRSEWTSVFCTINVMCHAFWRHVSSLPYQFSIFGGWQPCHIGILTGERLRFKRRTSHVPNLMHKLLKFIFTGNHCRPLNVVKMKGVLPGGGGDDCNTPGTFFIYLWSTDLWHHIRLQSCCSVLERSTKMDAWCYLVSSLF